MVRFLHFLRDTATELRKANWPWEPREKGVRKYKQLIDSTVVVVIALLLLGGTVAFFDVVQSEVIQLLANRFGK